MRACILTLALAGASFAAGPYPLGGPLPQVAADERAPAVVLAVHVRVRVDRERTTIDTWRAVAVRTVSGLAAAQYRLLVPGGFELEHFEGATRLAGGGDATPLSEADLGELVLSERGETRHVVRTVAFEGVAPGAVVEHSLRVGRSDAMLADRFEVLDDRPVREVVYELDVPADFEVNLLRRGFDVVPVPDPPSGRAVHRFRAYDVRPHEDLPFGVSHLEAAPSVAWSVASASSGHVDLFPTWGTIAAGLWRSVHERLEPPASWVAQRPAGEVAARIDAAWALVQARLADGVTGGGERTVEEMATSGFATEDERALALLGLLRAWDVPAHLALVPPAGADELLANFPTPGLRHDVLVCATLGSGERRWLDPSCLGCPAGALAMGHDGRYALLVEPVGDGKAEVEARQVRTPPTPMAPELEADHTLTLGDRGLVATEGKWALRGRLAAQVRAWVARHATLATEERDAWLRRRFLDGIEPAEMEIRGLDAPRAPIEVVARDVVVARRGHLRVGPWVLLPVDQFFHEPWLAWFRPDRTAPVRFLRSASFRNRARIAQPEGHGLRGIPEPREVTSPYGLYRLEVSEADGAVALEESLALHAHRIEPEDYAAFHAFLHQVRAARRQHVAFEREQVAQRHGASRSRERERGTR